MRLHQLTATAFGPFAGTVEVDFDALSDAGLFLLTGATGAGKSSVLDAVCFALYGEVPGDRHDAKHLRSDHAEEDTSPEVRLEFSVGDRRFLFTRSPGWERPKRRGTGTTRQQARVVVEERRAGSWQSLTTRLDDAGLLVTDLLGMTCTQFTQVAMLPQGRFQAFLRASSADRHAVLQRLFRTDRFERIERWLAEHRREVRQREAAQHDRVVTLAHRFSEAAGVPLPEPWALPERAGHTDAELTEWILGGLSSARDALGAATVAAELATEAHQKASVAHRETMELVRLQANGARARQAIQQLDEIAEEDLLQKDAVAAHRRAASIAERLDRVAVARDEVDRLAGEVAAALDFAEAPEATDAAVTAALGEAIRSEQQTRADLRLEAEHRQAEAEVVELADTIATVSRAIDESQASLEAIDAEIADRTSEVAELEVVAADLEARRLAHEAAGVGSAAAADVVETGSTLALVEAELSRSLDEAQRLREAHLDAREARISAMAGELAGQLASGCACPVCGSVEHPSPALGIRVAGREQEEAAQRAWETAEAHRLAAHEAAQGARARHEKAVSAAQGRSAGEWADALLAASEALESARTAAERLPQARLSLEALRTSHDARGRDLARHRADHAQYTSRLGAAKARLADTTRARDLARGDFCSLEERVAHHHERVVSLERARASVTALALAQSALAEAEAAAGRALDEAAFDSEEAARAALIDRTRLATIEQELAERAEMRRKAEAVLAAPDVRDAMARDDADLSASSAALDDAEAVRSSAEAALRATGTRVERLSELAAEADLLIAGWRPLREEFAVAEELSTLAEGTSRDNVLKMRLSAYVLGERLRQVVEAANDRLAVMTEQRYALEHTEERGVGAQRGGLSLRVRDDWTGIRRDPATLSGGETFVVSLALALGLADTVAHEAGGVPIETMFIDEGFGSLDAETLDGVMDTLDSLRNNGRVIGVVSHVAEMRERIPVGIEVQKSRRGSVLATR